MIVAGECLRLEALVPQEPVFSPDEFIRIKGARALDLAAQARLRELFVLRHELARESDLPPFKVLGNEVLIALAQGAPSSSRDLARVPGFSPKQARRYGEQVYAALERARRNGPLSRPPQLRKDGEAALTEEQFELHERLKQWRKTRAQREGFDASLVLNRHVLSRLAQQMPRTRDELARIEGLQPWQLASFGDELVDVIGKVLDELAREPASRPRRRQHRSRHN
jgi:ribonuclease D